MDIPAAFAYVPGSTHGADDRGPGHRRDTWHGEFTIPARGEATLRFRVSGTNEPGHYFATAGGGSDDQWEIATWRSSGALISVAPPAPCTITGTPGDDVLTGTPGDDVHLRPRRQRPPLRRRRATTRCSAATAPTCSTAARAPTTCAAAAARDTRHLRGPDRRRSSSRSVARSPTARRGPMPTTTARRRSPARATTSHADVEIVRGGRGNDELLRGTPGDKELYGGAGDDRLDGGSRRRPARRRPGRRLARRHRVRRRRRRPRALRRRAPTRGSERLRHRRGLRVPAPQRSHETAGPGSGARRLRCCPRSAGRGAASRADLTVSSVKLTGAQVQGKVRNAGRAGAKKTTVELVVSSDARRDARDTRLASVSVKALEGAQDGVVPAPR